MKIDKQTQAVSMRNLYALGSRCKVDLSLSENPLGCSPMAISTMRAVTQEDMFDYPDCNATALRVELAKRFNLQVGNFFFGNGSEFVIILLTKLLFSQIDEVIIPAVTFPMFSIASQLAGAKVVTIPLTKSFDIDLVEMKRSVNSKTRFIFICNPNNPTGRVLKRQQILNFVDAVDTTVIVDEANIEFSGESVVSDIQNRDNLVVLRTFSKAFGLAGLRIGYCAAHQTIIQELERISQPFPISSIAQKAALYALNDIAFITKTKLFMNKERNFLTKELTERGFIVVDSQANNLLVDVSSKEKKVSDFIKKLQGKDVSVVSGDSFPALSGSFVRVSPRKRAINRAFLTAIDQIYKK